MDGAPGGFRRPEAMGMRRDHKCAQILGSGRNEDYP